MNITECLKRLAYNELSNTAFSTGTRIKPEKIPMLVNCMNETLILLYTKFLLLEKCVYLETNEYNTTYILTTDHLQDKEEVDPGFTYPSIIKDCLDYDAGKYLRDSYKYPFTGDIIKILEVIDEMGFNYPINDHGNEMSLYTPSYNVLQVPNPQNDKILAVMYQGKHKTLSIDNLEEEIVLPRILYGVFFAYVAYLVFNSMQSENAMQSAQKFFNQYNLLVQEVINNDAVNNSCPQTNTRFKSNGWC